VQLVTDVAPATVNVFTPHATHEVAPAAVWPVSEPAPHGTQLHDAADDTPPADPFTNEFTPHTTHATWPVRPSVVDPKSHTVQFATDDDSDALAYVFTLHASHDVAPTDVLPVTDPAPHGSQSPPVSAELPYVPSPQLTHVVCPVRPAVQLPAAHTLHELTFDAVE
jgi:hypothetical protein